MSGSNNRPATTRGARQDAARMMGRVFAPVAASTLILDLFTKWFAFDRLDEFLPLAVIPGLLNFRISVNRGAVFGIGQGLGKLFIAFTVIASVGILWAAWVHGRSSRLLTWALGFLLGGALGNLWDRLVHGSVRDFIDVYAGSYHWPTFNVADTAICIGAGLIILYSWRTRSGEDAEGA